MAACAQVGFDRPRLGGRVVPVADAFSFLFWAPCGHPSCGRRRLAPTLDGSMEK